MYKYRDTSRINADPQTVSGDIVTIENKEDLLEVDVVNIMLEPIQEGSGTPSPDNVRPISGRTEVETVVSPTTSAEDGTTYTTALGRTVYGGTLEQVGGELDDSYGYADLGDWDWGYSASGSTVSPYFYANVRSLGLKRLGPFGTTVHHIVCSNYATVARNTTYFVNGTICADGDANEVQQIQIKDDRFTDATSFKQAMSGVQLVYELATPQTYQLTPTEVELLLGNNNVWSEDGEVSVTYALDISKLATLPAEAVSIDGTYIENVVEGYRTLYVKGRESLGTELNTYSVGTSDGEKVKGRRYPARVLTVGFQLLAPTDSDFRLRFNQLNNILSIGEADFVFNDEQDKFFTGYPVMDASVEAGRNNVTGEWQIYCAYPFKRSIAVTTLSSEDDTGVVIGNNSATFTFDYTGTQPARPVLRAEFASAKDGGDYTEDGDCGFVAFLDPDENIIQLGNPDVVDLDAMNKNDTVANSDFDTLTDWTASGVSVASITDTYWDQGAGQTQNYALGAGTLSRNTTGAVGFEFDLVHRLCVNAPAQTGTFKAHLMNGDDVVVGFEIVKTGNGTAGKVRYIVNNKVVGTDNIDLAYYNTHFGYCQRTAVYVTQTYYVYVKKKKKKKKVKKTRKVQNGWRYTQSNLNSGISRDGGVVTFSIGNLADRTFKDSDIDTTPVYDIVFEMTGNLHTNALRSASLISKKGVPFAEIPNVFTAGDIVEADCNDANVYLYRNGSAEGHLEPQYGALGNDWEDFELKVGQNIIRAVWSDWVDPTYKPVIKILFNEVYI